MKRAALYIRVSTREQKLHGFSIDAQLKALQDYCEQNNIEIAGIYNDAGISAHISYKKRNAMQSMIRDCQQGKIDIILVTKLDRFFRSVKDYYAVMDQIGKVPWRAIWEDYETETSAGIFKVNIMLSVAQAESDRTGERIKAVNEYKREKGEYVGVLPTGYIRENKKIVKDKNVADKIDIFVNAFLETLSMHKAREIANANGANFSYHICRRILKDEIYRGKANQEVFEPYIPADKVALIDSVVNRPGKEPHRKNSVHTYMFTGVMRCDRCGRAYCGYMHNSYRKKADGTIVYDKYPAYVCSGFGSGRCKRHMLLESTIERNAIAALKDTLQNAPKYKAEIQAENHSTDKEIKAINGKIRRLADMYEMGDIEREEYIEKRDRLKSDISVLELKRTPCHVPDVPDNWLDMYKELTQDNKRIFWQSILREIRIMQDKSVRVYF